MRPEQPTPIPKTEVTTSNWYCHHCQCGWYDDDVTADEACPKCGSHLTGIGDMAADLEEHGYLVLAPGEILWLEDNAAAGELRINDGDYTTIYERSIAVRDGVVVGTMYRASQHSHLFTVTDGNGKEIDTTWSEHAEAALAQHLTLEDA